MAGFERAIYTAFDKISGEVLNTDQVFNTQKNSFSIRKQFHRGELELYCCQCEQRLNISTSKLDRLYFKHEPGHVPCLLTSPSLTTEEAEQLRQAYRSKESDRHKYLKNTIAARLKSTPGVDVSSVAVDDQFFFHGQEKRKPDVYCLFEGKGLVFEIQLSNLSLRYILDRHDFYQKKGIYLIWILDNFDIRAQSQMNRDIKYLNTYENFFKLDETAADLRLSCDFKRCHLSRNHELYLKWEKASVGLGELKFDNELYQAYFFDTKGDRKDKEQLQSQLMALQRDMELSSLKAKIGEEVDDIIRHIRYYKQNGLDSYEPILQLIEELGELGVIVLNEKLRFDVPPMSGIPPTNKYLRTATRDDRSFIWFLLQAEQIKLDVNSSDEKGITALQEIHNNPTFVGKQGYAALLFKRGYKLKSGDADFLDTRGESERGDLLLYGLMDRLTDRTLIDKLVRNTSLAYILESARRQCIVGFNYRPDQWLAFGNNAVHSYGRFWRHIEKAFRQFGIWGLILAYDKKGVFKAKLHKLVTDNPSQDETLDELIGDLFPELLDHDDEQ